MTLAVSIIGSSQNDALLQIDTKFYLLKNLDLVGGQVGIFLRQDSKNKFVAIAEH